MHSMSIWTRKFEKVGTASEGSGKSIYSNVCKQSKNGKRGYFDQRGFARIDFKVANGKQDVSVNVETGNIAWFISPGSNQQLPGTFVILSMGRFPRGVSVAYATSLKIIESFIWFWKRTFPFRINKIGKFAKTYRIHSM